MNYKGKEVKEVNGADYPLGMTPKKMLVWTNADAIPVTVEREVLGFFRGLWLTPATIGVSQWPHAAEIPEEPKKKWRPFKDTAELFAHNNGHDILWLKRGKSKMLITEYTDFRVTIDGRIMSMGELLKYFTFADGTPCGVEEDA